MKRAILALACILALPQAPAAAPSVSLGRSRTAEIMAPMSSRERAAAVTARLQSPQLVTLYDGEVISVLHPVSGPHDYLAIIDQATIYDPAPDGGVITFDASTPATIQIHFSATRGVTYVLDCLYSAGEFMPHPTDLVRFAFSGVFSQAGTSNTDAQGRNLFISPPAEKSGEAVFTLSDAAQLHFRNFQQCDISHL